MNTSTITAIAHALPATVLPYEELVARFDERSVAAIWKMSGIRTRRVVAPGQCASDLALAAARRLLAEKQVDPATIDLIVFTSQTPDFRTPATATRLQAELGIAENCSAFDMNQACAAFIFTMQVAHSMVVAGMARRALMFNADAITTLVNPHDRGLVTLHGDAAVATLVEPCDSQRGGIEFIETGTAGRDYERLIVRAGGARMPANDETRQETTDETGCVRNLEQLYMDGPAVFHFVSCKVHDFLCDLLKRRGLTMADYDMVLLHQANKMMLEGFYRKLSVPPEKRFYYMEEIGNCAGSSLPAVLSEAWRAGKIKPGSRTLLCAFGGGLSWGAISIRWPQDAAAAVNGQVDVPAAVAS
jgi:3-oxoacyl-[acyl-carrier-protein] synthase III